MNTLLRSVMFVPGQDIGLLRKAITSEADALIPDLEDSVQPNELKQVARANILSLAKDGSFIGRKIFPRLNDRDSGFLLRDVFDLTVEGITGFVYPKAESAGDIVFIDKLLTCLELERGHEVGKFKLIPLIETTNAILNVHEICRASHRIIAIAFGCEDFLTDLGGDKGEHFITLHTPRANIAMAAKAAGIVAIDTVHVNVHDLDDLEKNLKIAKSFGFEGMLVLHPKELELVHKYFSPTPDEVAHSRLILELAQDAERDGKGVAILNGKFVGPPFIAKAKKVLNRHELIEGTKK
jgi:citrate lyase subunit beta / citryl-CoA lyase